MARSVRGVYYSILKIERGEMDGEHYMIHCPRCKLTVSAMVSKPNKEDLPEEGPTCAMGHPPVSMVVVTIPTNIELGLN